MIVRFLLIIPTVFILVTGVFFMMRITGDPITASLGGKLPPDQLAKRIHAAGYDRPIIVQYFEYLGRLFTRQLRHLDHRHQPITADPAHLRRRRRSSWPSTP